MLQKIMTPASMEYDTGSLKKSKCNYERICFLFNFHNYRRSKEDVQIEMDRLASLVDASLKVYDVNDDGYIYYGEFYRYQN